MFQMFADDLRRRCAELKYPTRSTRGAKVRFEELASQSLLSLTLTMAPRSSKELAPWNWPRKVCPRRCDSRVF